jgi:hypothetical protein
MSAANADVDAATRPAATMALTKFITGLHWGAKRRLRPIALPPPLYRVVIAAFTKV